MNKFAIDYYDAQEVASHILDINEDAEDFDELLFDGLSSEYGMNIDQLIKLLTVIVPLIDVAESPFTHTLYKGFATNKRWLVKIPVESE
jgi:hypothetical protein